MTARIRLRPISANRLPTLLEACRDCAPGLGVRPGEPVPKWARAAQTEWGLCGVGVHLGSKCAGYLLLCPSLHVPRFSPQSAGPHAADSASLLAIRVRPEHAGEGLGRQLVQSAAARATRLGIVSLQARGTIAAARCTLPPVGFLQAVGFELTVPHPLTPQLRLDLSRTVRWAPGLLDSALGRLGNLVRPLPPEPAGRAAHRQCQNRVGLEQPVS